MAAIAPSPSSGALSQALLASMAPDYQVQSLQAERRLQMAQALQQMSLQDTPGNGGAVSWTQGLARLADALVGSSMAKKGYSQMQTANQGLGRALSGAFMPQGAPQTAQGASPPDSGTPTPSAPQNAPQQPPFVPGAPVPPGQADPLAPFPASQPVAPPQATPPSAPSPAPTGGAAPMIPPLPGMSPQQSMMAYMSDPGGYWDKIAAANSPTDFAKLLQQSGIDPVSPLGRQIMQNQVAKQNYIAPISGRPGGVILDPQTMKPVFQTPRIGENQAVEFDAQGHPSRVYNIPGALQSAQDQAAAVAGGQAAARAPYDTVQGFQNGQPVVMPKSAVTGGVLNGHFYGPGHALPSGPSLGQQEAFGQYGKHSADAFAETQGIADSSPQRVQSLREMQSLINGPGALTTGPTSAKVQQMAEEHGLTFLAKDNAFVFNKDAARFVAQSAQDLGLNGSDQRLGMMANASPNMKMTPQALKVVIPTMIGLEYAKMAKATAAATWAQRDPGGNAKFESTWRQSYDPRMFTAYAQGGPQALAKAPANVRQQWLKEYRQLKGMGVDFGQFAQ